MSHNALLMDTKHRVAYFVAGSKTAQLEKRAGPPNPQPQPDPQAKFRVHSNVILEKVNKYSVL